MTSSKALENSCKEFGLFCSLLYLSLCA